MEGKKEEIKKGPWKAEEDEVLINHVKKYGPRDWSSIRTKGLLQHTGKSCRLRWVNKLRPNLKNGCKFSAEEERTVLELQAEFGNKWARIATYLPGRTDNDVKKNFWSSRQKRLTRILHNSSGASSSSNSKSHRFSSANRSGRHSVSCLEVPGVSSVGEALSASSSSSKMFMCSSSSDYLEPPEQMEMLSLPDHVMKLEPHQAYGFGTEFAVQFSAECQEVLARLDKPCFYDILITREQLSSPREPFFEPAIARSCRHIGNGRDDDEEPDVFFDDFPADMFDQMDSSLKSPLL